jgi:hypothetical protein
MQAANRFPYDLESITRNVPPRSGVYLVFSRAECVYIGESDDVCAGLLEISFGGNPCLNAKDLTHFTFELIAPELRVALQNHRIQEFRPACNAGFGSVKRGQPQFAQEGDQHGRSADQAHPILGGDRPEREGARAGKERRKSLEVFRETTWDQISEPGTYVERGTGDLYRILPEVIGSESSFVRTQRAEEARLVKLSSDPHLTLMQARLLSAEANIEPNF